MEGSISDTAADPVFRGKVSWLEALEGVLHAEGSPGVLMRLELSEHHALDLLAASRESDPQTLPTILPEMRPVALYSAVPSPKSHLASSYLWPELVLSLKGLGC